MRGHFGVVTLIVAVALSVSAPSSAMNATAVSSFDAADVAFGSLRSYQTVSIPGLGTMSAVGSPELPVRVLRFVIPPDASVEEVVVGHVFEEELPGTYRIAPRQPEVPIGETSEWVVPDATVYESDGLYPSERVSYLGDGYLGGYRIASVAVHPLQYEPATGRLLAATDVSVELVLGRGADRSARRARVTRRSDELYRSLVEGLVENPEDVASCRGAVEVVGELGVEGYSPRYTPSLDGSPVEYLIVTSDELEPYFQPLADWKTQKGVPAAIRTVSWIEANYPGGCDTAERIRLFLKDAYASWGTTYVLLGGDTQIVPV
ncbi:MAG: hypothetical protein JXB46_04615, partial [Candidatus Eisenbacteria bacterium]|nr:hypothetical protein [Candidatus Eisenbacteria bacterium]